MRNVVLFMLFVLLSGCATTEVSTDSPIEIEENPPEEEQNPSWYSPGKTGEVAEGSLRGYATARGIEAEWALENATRQANVNLRSWIDEQLEEARSYISDSDERASSRDFIIDLRNSVADLDLNETANRQQVIEENGSVRVLVMIRTAPDDVLDFLDRRMETHDELWGEMKSTKTLEKWGSP